MQVLLAKIVIGISIGFQLVILFLLVKRQLQRRFLWFLVYIGYALIEAVLRLSVAGNGQLYYDVYWLTEIGGAVFSILAVGESFLNVFRMYTRFRWFPRIVWASVALALMYSVFRAWVFPPINARRLTTIIIGLESAINYCLIAIGLLYFLLVRFQKIREHQWESGVISGFTTIGIFSALAVLTRSVFGQGLFNQWAEPVAFILAEMEWAFILSRPERERPQWIRDRELTIDDLTRLDEYIKVLERFSGRK